MAEESSVKTVTVQGVKLTVDPARLDDWELTETIADMQFGGPENGPKAVFLARKVLGDDYDRVKDHLRKRGGGRISNEAFATFIQDVFKAVAPNS